MRRFMFGVPLALFALATVALATTIVGGGKIINKTNPNFQSDKIITGSSGGSQTDNNYEFTFESSFIVCDVTVRMEDENGKEITTNANNGMYNVSVQSLPAGTPQNKPLNPNGSSTRIDLNPQMTGQPANFKVTVSAKSTASAVKFSMSFSTKPPGHSASCTDLATFEAGTGEIIARPILQSTAGLLLPIRNNSVDGLGFVRFELVGTMPAIHQVTVPGKSFNVFMDGDYAFYIVGDEIDPAETIEVFIEFESPTTNRGALIVTATES